MMSQYGERLISEKIARGTHDKGHIQHMADSFDESAKPAVTPTLAETHTTEISAGSPMKAADTLRELTKPRLPLPVRRALGARATQRINITN